MKLYVQLNFGGNCEEAFRFYEQHLGGKITMMLDQSKMPGAKAGAAKAIIHPHPRPGSSPHIAPETARIAHENELH